MNNLQLKTHRITTWNKFDDQIYSALLSRKLWIRLRWLVFWLTHFLEAFPSAGWQTVAREFSKSIFASLQQRELFPIFTGFPIMHLSLNRNKKHHCSRKSNYFEQCSSWKIL